MTPEEKEIMADMFYFLRDHTDPLHGRHGKPRAAQDIGALVGTKWKNHPLAMDLGIALYGYIEKKCKAKGGGST